MKVFLRFILFVLVFASCAQKKKDTELVSENPIEDTLQIQHLTYSMFIDQICDFEHSTGWSYKGTKPVIIDFYADWCQPCKRLSPILDELREEYRGKILFYKVNIDDESDLATACSVKSIPVLLFVPIGGSEPRPHVGLAEKDELKAVIREMFGL